MKVDEKQKDWYESMLESYTLSPSDLSTVVRVHSLCLHGMSMIVQDTHLHFSTTK